MTEIHCTIIEDREYPHNVEYEFFNEINFTVFLCAHRIYELLTAILVYTSPLWPLGKFTDYHVISEYPLCNHSKTLGIFFISITTWSCIGVYPLMIRHASVYHHLNAGNLIQNAFNSWEFTYYRRKYDEIQKALQLFLDLHFA